MPGNPISNVDPSGLIVQFNQDPLAAPQMAVLASPNSPAVLRLEVDDEEMGPVSGSYIEKYRARGCAESVAMNAARLDRWGRWLKGRRPRIGIERIDADSIARHIECCSTSPRLRESHTSKIR